MANRINPYVGKDFESASKYAFAELKKARSGSYSPAEILELKNQAKEGLTESVKLSREAGKTGSYATTRKRLEAAFEKAYSNRLDDLSRQHFNTANRYFQDGNYDRSRTEAAKGLKVYGKEAPKKAEDKVKALDAKIRKSIEAADKNLFDRAMRTGQALEREGRYQDAFAVYSAASENLVHEKRKDADTRLPGRYEDILFKNARRLMMEGKATPEEPKKK